MISIVIPTIALREQAGWLDRCIAFYEQRTKHPYEIIVERDHPHCGAAWNAGAQRARGDYVHFSADDLEPVIGWDDAALAVVEAGHLPAPRVLNGDLTLDSCGGDGHEELPDGAIATFTRVPFLNREMLAAILPIIPAHYATDMWVSTQARRAGFESVVAYRYCFIHYWAQEGRLQTYERDFRIYERRIA